MADLTTAPSFELASRDVIAVEHPMVIENIDKALKTFGRGQPFSRILRVEDQDGGIPLFLRPNDLMAGPLLSHNAATNNILLQITVPKRTGRKRKRGSQDAYHEVVNDQSAANERSSSSQPDGLCSHSRRPNPKELLRTLRDNVDKYKVEAVARIDYTHRFRALTDFHQSTSNGDFIPKFNKSVFPNDGKIAESKNMRDFQFDLKRGWKRNEEIMPPPQFTSHTLPFNWAWRQNPEVSTEMNKETGELYLANRSKTKKVRMFYVERDSEDVPTSSGREPPTNPVVCELIEKFNEAFNERPLWTQRALSNRANTTASYTVIRHALVHVSYQFKGGPFRDALIKYGVDPRKDQKYRIYQTLFFNVWKEEENTPFMLWSDVRGMTGQAKKKDTKSHLFDGKNIKPDGKIWQICDITDPLIVQAIENAPLRDECELKCDGWFSNGTWAKIRAIMKTKLVATRVKRNITDADFKEAMSLPDVVEENTKPSRTIAVPIPDLRLTNEEAAELAENGSKAPAGAAKYNPDSAMARKKQLKEKAKRKMENLSDMRELPTIPDHLKERLTATNVGQKDLGKDSPSRDIGFAVSGVGAGDATRRRGDGIDEDEGDSEDDGDGRDSEEENSQIDRDEDDFGSDLDEGGEDQDEYDSDGV